MDLLVQREDFARNLCEVLSLHLKNNFQWSGEVYCKKKRHNDNSLIIIPKLNVIFAPTLSTRQLRRATKEYSYHKNVLQRVLRHIYVMIHTNAILKHILNINRIVINPLPNGLENCCIIPGNHVIRIANYKKNSCTVYLKPQYQIERINSAIKVRQRFNIPGPELLSVGHEGNWFEESLIDGIPLDRVSDEGKREKALLAAKHILIDLYIESLDSVRLTSWLPEKNCQFETLIEGIPEIYNPATIARIRSLFELLQEVIVTQFYDKSIAPSVPVAVTHGDFQPANILVPFGETISKVWLIDWEYCADRCVWYDELVFKLMTRAPVGLASRLVLWLEGTNDPKNKLESSRLLTVDDLVPIDASIENYRLCLFTFLIEELLFRLEDTKIPFLKKPSEGFLIFIGEIESFMTNRRLWQE